MSEMFRELNTIEMVLKVTNEGVQSRIYSGELLLDFWCRITDW